MKGNFHARFLGGCGRVNRLHLPGATMHTIIANTLPPAQSLLVVLGFAALIGLMYLAIWLISLGGWRGIAAASGASNLAGGVFLTSASQQKACAFIHFLLAVILV